MALAFSLTPGGAASAVRAVAVKQSVHQHPQPLKPPVDNLPPAAHGNPFTNGPFEPPFGSDVRAITDTTTLSHNEPSI